MHRDRTERQLPDAVTLIRPPLIYRCQRTAIGMINYQCRLRLQARARVPMYRYIAAISYARPSTTARLVKSTPRSGNAISRSTHWTDCGR